MKISFNVLSIELFFKPDGRFVRVKCDTVYLCAANIMQVFIKLFAKIRRNAFPFEAFEGSGAINISFVIF